MIAPEKKGGASTASAQQRAVVEHRIHAPAIVDAGAGTGKTFTIVERVADLSADPQRGCPASNILLLTFSKKAAAELRSRIIRRLGPGVQPPECATFHAFALSLLREHGFELTLSPDSSLINDVDARVEFSHVFDDMLRGTHGSAAEAFPLRFGVVDAVRSSLYDICQRLRDAGRSPQSFRQRALAALDAFAAVPFRALFDPDSKTPRNPVAQISDADFAAEVQDERRRIEAAAALFERFERSLRERDALTYSDLLQIAVDTIVSRPEVGRALRGRFRHCIVDEYQDTDPRQIRLLEAMFGDECDRVMVVGDARQTIYGFRGIDPANLARFGEKEACVNYALVENRRSRQEILDLAHTIIAPQSGDTQPLRAVREAESAPVVHVRSHWGTPELPAPNAAQTREIEARWVAGKIAELLASGRRVESPGNPGEFEALAPRHIAILNRRKTQLQPLIAALNERDIRFRQYGGAGFYEAPEILDALAWLRLLTDPLDDAAVARALASPSVGLSDAAVLALCRGMTHDGSHLSSRVLLEPPPAGLDPDGLERIDRFRRTIDALDSYAGAPLVTAWEAVLDRAGLLLAADVRSGHRHDQARANLEKLSAMVRGFAERNPGARAGDFDRYVRELSLIEADDQEADPPSADAVSVMTIHAAKGLEWPIVFVIDVWPSLPNVYTPVRLDDETGALLVTEGPSGVKPFHTECVERRADAHGQVGAKRSDTKREQDEREDRRLFYVALTRARDELFVSGNRRPPSAKHRDGTVHPYLDHVITWVGFQGWSTIDEPVETDLRAPRQAQTEPTHALPLGDYVMERTPVRTVDVPALSFSSVARFEECPRSVTYRLAFGLRPLAPERPDDGGGADDEDGAFAPRDSLLSAGAYGEMMHRALESWARGPGRRAEEYVAGAVRDLGVKPSAAERTRAIDGVTAAMGALSGWTPLLAEAPFTLDLGDVSVTGYVDLVARDPHGEVVVVDYKTGVTSAEHYALQLALYRLAVHRAYGIDTSGCAIARIAGNACTLEAVPALDESAVRARIDAVAAGIRGADVTARPGPQCATCTYRAAPCMDFPQPR